jgi:3-oxoacyl-[acyl-carrier-protein] synthase-3
MIELGQIRAGLVVGTEGSRQLVETTIDSLNTDTTLSRAELKLAVASLTIGSGSCAMLLTDRELSQTDNRVCAATVRAHTVHHELCHSGQDEAVGTGMSPLMRTDSEQLMREGIATGVATYRQFLDDARWNQEDLDRTFCHQVGSAHRKLMLESLGLHPDRDFTTLEWLGNTGSVALPVTLAIGAERGVIASGERIGLLGIGSGINCIMVAVAWQKALVHGTLPETANEGRMRPRREAMA